MERNSGTTKRKTLICPIDNNRKTICRIYLEAKKCIGLMDDTKKEVKHELSTVDDIFKYSDNLIKTVLSYDKSKEPV